MKNNSSFSSKIISAVLIAFLLIFGIFYIVILNNYKKSILLEEEKKINLILNTISPMVAINLEFDITNNIEDIFKNVLKDNTHIKSIILYDLNNHTLVKINNGTKNASSIKLKNINDNTNQTIGKLRIDYSNINYIRSVEKFNTILLYILLFTFSLLLVFARYLRFLFKPLEELSSKLKLYNPKINKEFILDMDTTVDEFVIINNTISKMLDKIQMHTNTLEQKVKEEVEKNRQKESQLYEQSKLADMGNMIGNIAHQWRQPLSVISTIASGIILKLEFNKFNIEKLPEDMEKIVNSSIYLSETIDTFRDFIKEDKTLKKVIIQDKIEKSLSIVGSALKNHNIDIRKNIDFKNPIELNLITGELSQVIINILNNAKDALIEKDIKEKWIEISLFDNENQVIITIEDNASGIPPKIMSKIFEPYFTTKHKSKGTGLGLHMSYKIITESLKGEILVSNTNNGAIFTIKLPKKEGLSIQ